MIYQYEIWIADLNPQTGTETGKIRPVDNNRFIKKIEKLTDNQITTLKTNLKIILDLNDLH